MIETLFCYIIQVIEKWIVVSALISFAYFFDTRYNSTLS